MAEKQKQKQVKEKKGKLTGTLSGRVLEVDDLAETGLADSVAGVLARDEEVFADDVVGGAVLLDNEGSAAASDDEWSAHFEWC